MKSGPISWNRGRVSYHSMLKLISAPKWIILGRTHLEEPRLNTQHHLKFILKYWTRSRDEPLKYLLLRNCLFFPGTPPPTPLPLSSREAFDFRPMTARPSVPPSETSPSARGTSAVRQIIILFDVRRRHFWASPFILSFCKLQIPQLLIFTAVALLIYPLPPTQPNIRHTMHIPSSGSGNRPQATVNFKVTVTG